MRWPFTWETLGSQWGSTPDRLCHQSRHPRYSHPTPVLLLVSFMSWSLLSTQLDCSSLGYDLYPCIADIKISSAYRSRRYRANISISFDECKTKHVDNQPFTNACHGSSNYTCYIPGKTTAVHLPAVPRAKRLEARQHLFDGGFVKGAGAHVARSLQRRLKRKKWK